MKYKPKRTIKINELTEADAQFISIVGRGANNAPFKVIKQENDMALDLGKLFKKEDKSFVQSVVVNKAASTEETKAKLEKAGFSVQKQEDQDGVIVFSQTEEIGENQVVIKYNEDIAVIVSVDKYFDSWDFETDSFTELFSKQGVLPTLGAAHGTLWDVMMNVLFDQDTKDPVAASAKISTAIKEYRSFVTEMIKGLPVSAFKFDDPSLVGDAKTTEEEKQMSDIKDEVKKDDEPVIENQEQEEPAQEEPAQEEAKEEAEKAVDEQEDSGKESDISEVLKAVQSLASEIKDLRASVEKGAEEAVALKDRVEEVASVAKSADEALNGTTNAGAQGDRTVQTKEANKASEPVRSSAYKLGKQYYN